MKTLLVLLILFLSLNSISKAQSSSEKSALKEMIKPDLNKKIFAIPVNDDYKTINHFSERNKSNYKKFETVFYTYKLSLGQNKDQIKISTKPVEGSSSEVSSGTVKFSMSISYSCTDQNHDPRHGASTLDEMKKIQKVKNCTGIQILILD